MYVLMKRRTRHHFENMIFIEPLQVGIPEKKCENGRRCRNNNSRSLEWCEAIYQFIDLMLERPSDTQVQRARFIG